MSAPRLPGVDTLCAIRGVTPSVARIIRNVMRRGHAGELREEGAPRSASLSKAVYQIDALLETHGVESIRREECGGYWGDTAALYANAGEAYAATVLYDVCADRFRVTSCGDWVEAQERRGFTLR